MSQAPLFGLKPLHFASLAALAVAAAIGGYALYSVTAGGDDGKNRQAATATTGSGTGSFRALATGKMAAFLVARERKAVPDLSFEDETGARRRLAEWRGRVVLLNLWATWCAPCRKEMPQLAELQKLHGGKAFEVIALSIDRKGAEASAKFLTTSGSGALKLYIDPTAQALSDLKGRGLPVTLLIDRAGNEIGRLTGPADWASQDAKALIKAALAEKTGS